MSQFDKPSSTWLKLIRQPSSLIGGCISVIAFLLAITGYWISPDSSPDANRMIVEIASRSPGFTQQFLLIPKSPRPASVSWWERTLNGQPDSYSYLPIGDFHQQGDTLYVQQFIDDGLYEERTFLLSALHSFQTGIRPPDSPQVALKSENNSIGRNSYIKQQRFLLGTDKFGRDILSRLIIGTRISLMVGGIAMILSLTIGLLLGTLAGYYGGKLDALIMWFINVIWSIPTLLLVFAITLLLGKGFWQVFIAVGLTMWVNVARLVRGQLIAVRNLEYVEAAKALGYRDWRIMVKHILPNIMGPVLVVAAANFASAIVVEAGLSFLGVGVQPPQPSWGGMIKENYNFIITNNPMLALAPGFAIMLLVLAFNLIGNGIRDALDVRS
ncbi:ABC transporter permease [Flavihumibacter sp. UBA7668]|uniref:ABC transporter permease n=1 Tax=Flavihumibacter sp. UBA7668 TaxID=1946542 RepID=UPI0025B8C0C9|nr:ABC transporter permease [Flavihumibacter sp. UBA7668]